MRIALLTIILALLWGTTATAWAQDAPAADQQQSDDGYGIYYGDGLRHLAEGRHDEAVGALFRAYGLQPSAHVMELIIDGYDSMGHCDGAKRQLRFFQEHHGDDGDPELHRCSQTGQLVIDCDGADRSVQINHDRQARCGDVIEVPADEEHRIAWDGRTFDDPVTVDVGEQQLVEAVPQASERSAEEISVARLPGIVGQVARLPVHRRTQADVPRLPASDQTSSYRVYETSDGIFQVWSLHSGTEGDEEATQVEIICPEDAPGGQEEAECIMLRDSLDERR